MWLHHYDSFCEWYNCCNQAVSILRNHLYLKSFYMNADINQKLLEYIQYWEHNKHEHSG